ncbi:beta-flanking protein [Boletus reticuloceps]|uniref:Beta-flanking protein n=1 Tax=Boletus reticuloceps TaxID=495285 RepID=A0A8I2YWZ4_9AGAM|nr:beta-flanking protein [Boletus reticuloceps]
MSSFFGLAEQVISAATSGGSSESEPTVRKTGGEEYNSPHHRQQPQGGFDTQEVLSHAGADDDDEGGKGYIANAIHHVQNNSHQAHEQVGEDDMAKYGPMIFSALSSATSKSGIDIGTLVSGGLGEGGGNQLMGLVMKEAGNAFVGGGGGDKQSMMNGAAMTLTKLVAQKQLSAFTGGSNSGGLSMLGIGETLLKSRFG